MRKDPADYLVDVNIACYNQEKYIAQALDSVLCQKTNFRFRIIIGDDCSTDGSAEIIRQYAERYPDIIQAHFHPVNLGFRGPVTNGLFLLKKSTSRYITLLDGDDYWDNPDKLQKQVDILENNPDISNCFHTVRVIYTDGQKESHLSNKPEKQISTFEDLAYSNFITTASSVFRNNFNGSFPEWFHKVPAGDWTVYLLNARFGNIYFIDEPMAVYRINSTSTWANQSVLIRFEKMIRMLDMYEEKFDPRYRDYFRKSRSFYYMEISSIYHQEKKKIKEFIYFSKACRKPNVFNMGFRDVIHKLKELALN